MLHLHGPQYVGHQCIEPQHACAEMHAALASPGLVVGWVVYFAEKLS
jgi:hypothetical protein